ncbi:hypothetical protein B5F36_01490 [Anaerofilum sp. An201]|nr:hypothetical protein [Anaerofilum sp. An201]OUP04965.1 hypothetical protein B5F36_01490 [Anaerofilum sp. An201]
MKNNERIVVVFNGFSVPLRHIISTQISGPDHIAEFKQWYYENFHEFPSDQFVFCHNRAERDAVVTALTNGALYRIAAPVWGEIEDDEGITDVPDYKLKQYTEEIQKVLRTYTENSDFSAFLNEEHLADIKEKVRFIWPCIETYASGRPEMAVYVLLVGADIEERQWNRLLDALQKWLLEGWGEELSGRPASAEGKNIYLHSGRLNYDEIEFHVKKVAGKSN